LAFETHGSVFSLAEVFARDVSVMSRQLQKLAQQAPVLEKQQGKWRLTPLGRQINQWTRDAAEQQIRILRHRKVIRIGATREFAARVLVPQLAQLGFCDETEISVITHEEGVENLLLRDEVDFGFDCGRPNDPAIRFKLLKAESFGIFGSPKFLKENQAASLEDLLPIPHLNYKRIPVSRYLELDHELTGPRASFNDLAAAREACVAGLGWAGLPNYAVRTELASGTLKEVPHARIQAEKYGVWWVRGRDSLAQYVSSASTWLGKQKL
jgi:DNA-binding transcriptional LysR family regulator